MPHNFDPNPADPIDLFGQQYVVQPHPQAPYMPYRQRAGRARVYQLRNGQEGQYFALKEFKKLYRTPNLIDSARNLRRVESFEGLHAAKRRVVLPDDLAAQRYPNLEYAMLMPWIHGRTWFDVLGQAQEDGDYPDLSTAIRLCDRFLKVVEGLEADEMAHTDISPGNVMVGFDPIEVQLVDLEEMYMPGVDASLQPHSGSNGYSHRSGETTWKPQGDRYAAAVLAAEMLILAKPELARKATDEGFFVDHCQTPEGMTRFREARPWLEEVAPEFAEVFERSWYADSLEGCPSISELREPINKLANRPLVTESPKRVETPISRQPSAGTTQKPFSANRLAELYAQARQLHRDQEWKAVIDLFDQIHALDPAYPDTEGLLVSAREALPALDTITASNAGRIQLLRTMGREERKSWVGKLLLGLLKAGHTGPVNSVAFSPDGRLLASGSGDKTVRLWRVEDGVLLHALEWQWRSGKVFSVAFSPDGRLLASSADEDTECDDGTVTLWRVEDGAPLYISESLIGVGSVAFSPDGRLVSGSIPRYSEQMWAGMHRVSEDRRGISRGSSGRSVDCYGWGNVALSPDGQLLASGSGDKTVRLRGRERDAFLQTLEGHTGSVNSVAFSPDGRLLASGSGDKTVRLWRIEDGALLRTLEGHTNWVSSVAFSPDGRLLASGAYDDTVRLWCVEDGALLSTLEGHAYWVLCVAFSPDGRLLASGSEDKTVRLWGIA